MATQAATFLATFGDRYFLQRAADSTVVGLYTLAYQFGFLLVVVGYLPFHLAWDPARFALAHLPREKRDPVYARAFIRSSVLLLTMAVLLALFVGDFLRIMAAPAFHPAAQFVPVLLVAYVLKSWTDFHNLGILVSERTEFQTLADWVGAFTALAGFAWLIPRYHAAGAAGVAVAAFAVRYALVYLVSQRLWPVRYEWRRVRRLVAIASAAALAGIAVSVRSVWLSIGVNALLFGCYALAVWFLGVLAPADRATLRAAARQVSQLPTMLRSRARQPQTSLHGEGEASS
jgi:O-antigen/teichoic acid export membrane protein